ncbi:MAG: galactose oxidase [Pseudomonadota bacterium]
MMLAALAGCAGLGEPSAPGVRVTDTLPPLPQPVANNAVATVDTPDGPALLSFLGLGEGRTWRDIHNRAYALLPGADAWETLPDVPGPGRLAATAVAVGDRVILLGGYTVAEDGHEVSVPAVYEFDLAARVYASRADMPVPVDDAVSLVYRDRYVYLVSGWHDTGNVNLVQVYDAVDDRWFQATPFPGRPVFGHAGALSADTLVVCDGVGIRTTRGRRAFEAVRACYRGVIDAEQPARIDWTVLDHPPGPARYRAAAATVGQDVWLIGGSDNPYNYNGIGYDGVPSAPIADVAVLDLASGVWRREGTLDRPSMDHRGALPDGTGLVLVGGMLTDQQVTRTVRRLRIGGAASP